MRRLLLVPLAGAAILAGALAGCANQQSASRDAFRVGGDYRALSFCLRGELALYSGGGRLVGYAVDEAQQRARIWRDLPERRFDNQVESEDYNIFVTQSAPQEVEILVRQSGLDFDRNRLLSRLVPMLQRCTA
jgi:hypothetical protein